MITTVGAIILNNLSQEIRDSKFFSIMSDEVADISNIEKSFSGDQISPFEQNSQRRIYGILTL